MINEPRDAYCPITRLRKIQFCSHALGINNIHHHSRRGCRAHPKLSLPDAFAYVLASARGWTLLTGDGELRALAQAESVQFFGVLWVVDQLFDGQVMEAAAIVTGLETIAAHPRCRLPGEEIRARLERHRKPKT